MSAPTLDCPHQDAPAAGRQCEHLIADPGLEHCRWFTGIGRVCDLICTDCAADLEEGVDVEDQLGFVCASCFGGTQAYGVWSPERGLIGEPEIAERREDLAFLHDMVRPARPLGAAILDFQAVEEAGRPIVVALLEGGRLVRIDLEERRVERLLSVALEPGGEAALKLSPRGDLAAVVAQRGRRGMVVDLDALRPTIELDRGAEESYESDFPIAFVEREGKSLVVHATGAGRLDVSDARSGELLTERDPGDRGRGYHHGGLLSSPTGAWIADNGWVDGPAGFVSAWSVDRWLEENPFESEDGPSKKYFEQRWYFWDGPLCWIDDRTLAIWGFGPDEALMLDAIELYDVAEGVLLGWFPGPALGRLVFDRWLFSVSDEVGTSVWDVKSGELVHRDAGFHPHRYHRGVRRFLTAQPEGDFFVLSRLVTRG